MIAADTGKMEMTRPHVDLSPQFWARVTGLLYLIKVPLAIFGIAFIPSLVVPGDAAATVSNLIASEFLVRLSIISSLVVQVSFIFLLFLLYRLLQPVNRTYSLLMVVLMMISIPLTMISELNPFAALMIVNRIDPTSGFTVEQAHTLVPLLLDLREHGIFIANIYWGLWLFPFGYLVCKSGYIPKIFGILLMIGCAGYVIDFLTFVLAPDFGTISQVTGWGEILLPLWLLIKGVNVDVWNERTLESTPIQNSPSTIHR